MLLELLPKELSPETIIHIGGAALLFVVIFLETGVFFGCFLPGDSLLFTAGLLCESQWLSLTPVELIPLLITAAVFGTATGFFFGKWTGDFFSHRKENFFYKKKYVELTQEYFQKYGMMAFVIGRFIPIVRTFMPILAGIAKIEGRKFWLFNILGAVLWVTIVVTSGYLLGRRFPQLAENIGMIAIVMIVVSTLPLAISVIKNRIVAGQNTK
jgi:membrane-associated protein